MTVLDRRRTLYRLLVDAGWAGRDITGGAFELRHAVTRTRLDLTRTGSATLVLVGFTVARFTKDCPDEAIAAAAIACVPADERLAPFDALRRGEAPESVPARDDGRLPL